MKKVLLLTDLQNDFADKNGSLYIPKGEDIISLANRLMISDKFHCIAVQDKHPLDHCSFYTTHKDKKAGDLIDLNGVKQILLEPHCVSGTKGADFHKNLLTGKLSAIFRKGLNREIDDRSAFMEGDQKTTTGLAGYLRELKTTELYIMGLTLEHCVKRSVLDAIELGFKTHLILDGCKASDVKADKKAIDEMIKEGVAVIENGDALIK